MFVAVAALGLIVIAVDVCGVYGEIARQLLFALVVSLRDAV